MVPMRGVAGDVPMPLLGVGTWEYNSSLAEYTVTEAFKLGYRHVDTAQVYANQVGVGRALRESGLKRGEYFVTTKIVGGLNETGAAAALKECLLELDLDYVDLMLVHYPATWSGAGGKASRQETWKAMEKFARAGGARAIGVSHYCRQHVEDVLEIATVPVAANQVEYHVGLGSASPDDSDDKAWMQAQGIVYEPFSPLCGPCGTLDLITGEIVTRIGKAHGKSGAQVSLRWLTQQNLPVIAKSDNPKHLLSNMDIFDWNLTAAEMAVLTEKNTPVQINHSHSGDCAIGATLTV